MGLIFLILMNLNVKLYHSKGFGKHDVIGFVI